MKKTLLISAVLLGIAAAKAQNVTDLDFTELHGPVFEVKTGSYYTEQDDTGKPVKGLWHPDPFHNETTAYNPHGYLQYIISLQPDGEYDTTVFFMDGHEPEEIGLDAVTVKCTGDTIIYTSYPATESSEKAMRIRLPESNTIEISYDRSGEINIRKDSQWDGRFITNTTTAIPSQDIEYNTRYEKISGDTVCSTTEGLAMDGSSSVTYYTFTEFDSYGNWTQRLTSYGKADDPSILTERRISYWEQTDNEDKNN